MEFFLALVPPSSNPQVARVHVLDPHEATRSQLTWGRFNPNIDRCTTSPNLTTPPPRLQLSHSPPPRPPSRPGFRRGHPSAARTPALLLPCCPGLLERAAVMPALIRHGALHVERDRQAVPVGGHVIDESPPWRTRPRPRTARMPPGFAPDARASGSCTRALVRSRAPRR